MINNISRIGNFTSSEIGKLMTKDRSGKGFGAPALAYIDEKNMERRLGRSISTEIGSRPTSWGNMVELQAFNLLGLKYKPTSKETISHGTIPFWCGSPDGFYEDENGITVYDIKCPITLKSFCQLTDSKTIEDLRENHKEGDTYFWQLVSNAVLTNARFAELIVYCPYQEELDAIRELASNFDGNQNKIAWIGFAQDDDLPYLIKGNHYHNLNIIRFEVTAQMKAELTQRVMAAGEMLINPSEQQDQEPPIEQRRKEAQEKIKLMKELQAIMKKHKNGTLIEA